jgi:hypothetical protein
MHTDQPVISVFFSCAHIYLRCPFVCFLFLCYIHFFYSSVTHSSPSLMLIVLIHLCTLFCSILLMPPSCLLSLNCTYLLCSLCCVPRLHSTVRENIGLNIGRLSFCTSETLMIMVTHAFLLYRHDIGPVRKFTFAAAPAIL